MEATASTRKPSTPNRSSQAIALPIKKASHFRSPIIKTKRTPLGMPALRDLRAQTDRCHRILPGKNHRQENELEPNQ